MESAEDLLIERDSPRRDGSGKTVASISTPSRPPQLTRPTNILYGVGSIAFGIHNTSLTSALLLFFNQVMGLPSAWVSGAMMITLIFDAICDPLIGEWSDHTRSRWGRRHPFMYAAAVPAAIAFYVLFNPPVGWSQRNLFLYLLVALVSLRLLLSLYEVPSAALGPELTYDYDQRTSLMSWRFFFGTLGGSAIAVLALQVFLRKDATHPLGVLNRAGYGQMAVVASAVLPPSSRVLDAGCGAGVPLTRMLAQFFTMTGVDISAHQIELGRRNVPSARFIHADMTALDLPLRSFDAVVASYSFIHVPRAEHAALLRRIGRWLKPGGILLANFGISNWEEDYEEDWLGAPMF